jgi:hypothetical protein
VLSRKSMRMRDDEEQKNRSSSLKSSLHNTLDIATEPATRTMAEEDGQPKKVRNEV